MPHVIGRGSQVIAAPGISGRFFDIGSGLTLHLPGRHVVLRVISQMELEVAILRFQFGQVMGLFIVIGIIVLFILLGGKPGDRFRVTIGIGARHPGIHADLLAEAGLLIIDIGLPVFVDIQLHGIEIGQIGVIGKAE